MKLLNQCYTSPVCGINVVIDLYVQKCPDTPSNKEILQVCGTPIADAMHSIVHTQFA